MSRFVIPTAVLLLGAGCVGTIGSSTGGDDDDGSGSNVTPATQMAMDDFVMKAYPALVNAQCVSCHNGSRSDAAAMLAGSDALSARTTLLAFDPPVVNLQAPSSSQLVTHGAHTGPAMDGATASIVDDWMELERDAAGDGSATTTLTTTQFMLGVCDGSACPPNHVVLDGIGSASGGASIDFTVQQFSSGIYVNDLTLNGGANGVYIEHPLFVSYPAGADPIPDQLDRYYATKIDLTAGSAEQIEGGTAYFNEFVPSDPVAITFKVVDVYENAAGSGSGSGSAVSGCQELASFKTNAQAPLQTNCFSCHGGSDPNATSAMDLSNLNASDDPTLLLACDQVRTRINFQDIENSGFYIEPEPNDGTNHNFKFPSMTAFNTFHDAVNVWALAEQADQ